MLQDARFLSSNSSEERVFGTLGYHSTLLFFAASGLKKLNPLLASFEQKARIASSLPGSHAHGASGKDILLCPEEDGH